MKSFNIMCLALLILGTFSPCRSVADEADDAEEAGAKVEELQLFEHPIAILPFQERGKEVKELGGKVADLIFANLVTDPELFLVDRESLDKTLAEMELNLSGIVDPKQANVVGQLTGAQIIITGSVFQIDNKNYVVAKVIGAETSRVIGASANGPLSDGLDELTAQLAKKVVDGIKANGASLVARRVSEGDRIEKIKDALGDAKRPVVFVSITEQHVGPVVIDPAAETEMTMLCTETGFTVIDPDEGSEKQSQYLIQGEGLSEYAARHGNLISVKGRVEVKVIERSTGKVIAVDRQTRMAVDLSEHLAGKAALEQATAAIAERLLPKLIAQSAK
jgi:TolB-like protein